MVEIKKIFEVGMVCGWVDGAILGIEDGKCGGERVIIGVEIYRKEKG